MINEYDYDFLKNQTTMTRSIRNIFLKNNKDLKEAISYVKKNKINISAYNEFLIRDPKFRPNNLFYLEVGSELYVQVCFIENDMFVVYSCFKNKRIAYGSEGNILLNSILSCFKPYKNEIEDNVKIFSINFLNSLISRYTNRKYHSKECRDKRIITHKIKNDENLIKDIEFIYSKIYLEEPLKSLVEENIQQLYNFHKNKKEYFLKLLKEAKDD